MAELRDEIAIYLCERFDGEDWEECSIEDNVTYQFNADSIISLMLAKVDKALLTEEQIRHIPCELNETRLDDYKSVAKAQLQAIKDILEGE